MNRAEAVSVILAAIDEARPPLFRMAEELLRATIKQPTRPLKRQRRGRRARSPDVSLVIWFLIEALRAERRNRGGTKGAAYSLARRVQRAIGKVVQTDLLIWHHKKVIHQVKVTFSQRRALGQLSIWRTIAETQGAWNRHELLRDGYRQRLSGFFESERFLARSPDFIAALAIEIERRSPHQVASLAHAMLELRGQKF